jgi:hypothetical protein
LATPSAATILAARTAFLSEEGAELALRKPKDPFSFGALPNEPAEAGIFPRAPKQKTFASFLRKWLSASLTSRRRSPAADGKAHRHPLPETSLGQKSSFHSISFLQEKESKNFNTDEHR